MFLAAVQGDTNLLHGLHEAITNPHFPLYLGRRSCPPVPPVSLGVHDGDLVTLLSQWPWQAAARNQRQSSPHVRLEIVRDTHIDEPVTETIQDQPITFDPHHRQHTWRPIVRHFTNLPNPHGRADIHNPMAPLGG